jgi:hypothetical protein
LSEFKRSNLKVTRKRENSSWATWQGGCEYFHETFVRHHSNLTKHTIFIVFLGLMIKTINICVFLSSIINIQ